MKQLIGFSLALVLLFSLAVPAWAEESAATAPFRGDGFEMTIPADWEVRASEYGYTGMAELLDNSGKAIILQWSKPGDPYEDIEGDLHAMLDDLDERDGNRVLGLERTGEGPGNRIWRFRGVTGGSNYESLLERYGSEMEPGEDQGYGYMVYYVYEREDLLLLIGYLDLTGGITGLINDSIASLRFHPEFTAQ